MERIKALESIEPDVISYNSLVYALVQEPWVFEVSDSPSSTYDCNDDIACPRFANVRDQKLNVPFGCVVFRVARNFPIFSSPTPQVLAC